MNNQRKLQAILEQLRKARGLAAVAELRAFDERESAEPSEAVEKRERYEYIVGKFQGLDEAVDIVNSILKPDGK